MASAINIIFILIGILFVIAGLIMLFSWPGTQNKIFGVILILIGFLWIAPYFGIFGWNKNSAGKGAPAEVVVVPGGGGGAYATGTTPVVV